MEIKITHGRLKELEQAAAKLAALEAGGVQSWEWYDASLEEFNKSAERAEAIEECLNEIEVALLASAYEPSERGAGMCSTHEGRVEAEKIFLAFVDKYLENKKLAS